MTNSATATKTPGYSYRIEIWFKTDRRGRRTAWYYSYAAMRAIRIGLEDAELFIAQDQAGHVTGSPLAI